MLQGCDEQLIYPELKKSEFQLVLWASSSHIFLSQDHFLLISVTDCIRGWLCGQVWFKSYLFWTTRWDCFQVLYPITQNLARAAISPVFFFCFQIFFPLMTSWIILSDNNVSKTCLWNSSQLEMEKYFEWIITRVMGANHDAQKVLPTDLVLIPRTFISLTNNILNLMQ